MFRRTLAVAVIGFVSACSPALLRDVAVDWENRTENVYTITFAQGDELRASAHVSPCEAAGMGIQMAGAFSIGVASGGGPGVITEPGAEIADSTAWPDAGFVVVVIEPNGPVTVEERAERVTPADGICP